MDIKQSITVLIYKDFGLYPLVLGHLWKLLIAGKLYGQFAFQKDESEGSVQKN